MCNDLGAALLTEDGGKQAGCYGWNLKLNVSFPLKPELLNFGTGMNKPIHLKKKKVWMHFFIILLIYFMHSKQWQPVFHTHFISLQLRSWHFWSNLWLTQTWTHFLSIEQGNSLSSFPYLFGWLVIFYVITVTFSSMCSLAISPQAFNSTQKNRFNSAQIMPDNVSFHTG